MNSVEPIIKQFEIGPMQNFVYFIADPDTLEAAVVDPGWETDLIIAKAKDLGFKLTAVFLTHGHYDHATQAKSTAEQAGNIPIYANELEKNILGENFPATYTKDGQHLKVGKLDIKCIHTPGHSPGSQCFECGAHLLAGDMLFIDHIGRTDLPGGDPKQMYESIQKLKKLPDETVVYPGHRYHSKTMDTIANQKQTNAYFRIETLDQFLYMS